MLVLPAQQAGRAEGVGAPMLALPLRFVLANAIGLLFIAAGAALYGPTPWSSARLLRTGRRVTATVVRTAASGVIPPAVNPAAPGIQRPYLPTVRLAFTLDGRELEKTLRLREPGAETAYEPGQKLEIYVARRLRTRIRSASEPNVHGPFEQTFGPCLILAGVIWLVFFNVALAT
jgi:hypothetical protein